MCGRFTLDISRTELEKRFRASVRLIKLTSSYNVSPGSFIPAIIAKSPNQAILMKWGLIPHWSHEFKVKFSTINARSENLLVSRVFHMPFQNQRCLIPTNGFYEWKLIEDKRKQPYFIHIKNSKTFSFAGLYDTWEDAEKHTFYTCTIVTTRANDTVAPIHNRMPVILPEQDEDVWLSMNTPQDKLMSLLVPFSSAYTIAYPVSLRVNNPKFYDAGLIEKLNGT